MTRTPAHLRVLSVVRMIGEERATRDLMAGDPPGVPRPVLPARLVVEWRAPLPSGEDARPVDLGPVTDAQLLDLRTGRTTLDWSEILTRHPELRA